MTQKESLSTEPVEPQSPLQLLAQMRDKVMRMDEQFVPVQSLNTKNIAYTVAGTHFFCEAQDVSEVRKCEDVLPVPQTKPWMTGIKNIKGVLYSVTDLALFASLNQGVPQHKGHLLLLRQQNMQASLLVEQVLGFRYFKHEDRISDIQQYDSLLNELLLYVDEAYKTDDTVWFKLNIPKLLSSVQFNEVQ